MNTRSAPLGKAGIGITRADTYWGWLAVTTHRLSLLIQIIRLLLTLVPQQRQGIVREAGHTYKMESTNSILQNVPFS